MSQRENLPGSDQHLGVGEPETKQTSLKKGTLGLYGIVFFVIAAAAPLAGLSGPSRSRSVRAMVQEPRVCMSRSA